jgi:phage tail sheath gpL-like
MTSFAFDAISSSQRVPGSQAEISNVRAVQGLLPAQYKLLLVGMANGAPTVTTPQRVTRGDDGAALGGRGSMLHAMCVAAIAANAQVEIWALPVAANAAGTAATGTITIGGPSTGAGTLSVMIDGQRVQVGVASGASANTVASALSAAINANADLPVTAAVASAVVTLTARHKGNGGHDIDLRVNYYAGELLPAGITATIVNMSGGATNPELAPVMAALGDEHYPLIALGWNDTVSLSALETELAGRWGPARQIEGRAFVGLSGSFSTLSTFGAARNSPHMTIVGGYRIPRASWAIAAAFASVAAYHLQIDPARPLTDLVVTGLLPPTVPDRFTRQERELLLHDGISTFRVNASGEVAIERLISTYQVNSGGFDDPSYLDITTTATLAYYRTSWRARMAQKFPRAKLTAETIAAVRAETIAIAREWEEAGLMESADGFIAGLILERDTTNVTQLNLLMTPDVVNGLLQLAARIEFIL